MTGSSTRSQAASAGRVFSTYRYECRDCGTVFISEENRAHVEASGRKCPFCGLTMEFIGVIG